MKRKIVQAAAMLAILPGLAHANVVLNGLSFKNTDAFGSPTPGGNVSYNVGGTWGMYLANGDLSASPSYINTNDSTANLNVDLGAGTYRFSAYMLSASGGGETALFFDGTTAPQISVFAADSYSIGASHSYAGWSGSAVQLGGSSLVTAIASLSWDNGVSTVRVTDYQVFDGSVLGGLGFPGVGPHDLVPFGVQNTAISFTLEVTNDLPEPGPVGVLALGVLGLVPVSRWRPRLHGAPAAAPRRATQGRL